MQELKGIRYVKEEGQTKKTKVCWECGGVFYVYAKHDFGEATKYCSNECKIKGQTRDRIGKKYKVKKKKKAKHSTNKRQCLNVMCNKFFRTRSKYVTKTVKNYKRLFDKRSLFCCTACENTYKAVDYREKVESKIVEFELAKKDLKNDIPELQRLIIVYRNSLQRYNITFTEKDIEEYKKKKKNTIERLQRVAKKQQTKDLVEDILNEELTIEQVKDMGVKITEEDVEKVIKQKEIDEEERRKQLLQQSRNIWLMNR